MFLLVITDHHCKKKRHICLPSKLFYFCQRLRTRLSHQDISENPNSEFRLNINPLKQKQRVFTLERDASAAEFELKRGIRFVLESKNKEEPLVEKDLFRESIFRDSDATKISKDRERSRLENTLDDELVNTVIRELSSIRFDQGNTDEY